MLKIKHFIWKDEVVHLFFNKKIIFSFHLESGLQNHY